MNPFENKVAIVTGGASGIGREMCLYLARRNAIVVIADINQKGAEEVADEVGKLGAEYQVEVVNVSDRSSMEEFLRRVRASHDRIDLMINNAGVGLDGEFKDMTFEQWESVTKINYWGVIYGTYYAYQAMLEQGFGQIVNVSSLAGLIPGGLMTSYVASKHAVVGFSLALRAEAKLYGIKINALCPGFIETPLHDSTEKVSDYLLLEKSQRNKAHYPTADQCIKPMMRGVEKNRAIIVVPRLHKMLWWVYRISPSLIVLFWVAIIKKLKR